MNKTKLKLFIPFNPDNFDLERSLARCISALNVIDTPTPVSNPVVPKILAALGRGRVDAWVLTCQDEPLHLAKAVLGFLNVIVRFRSTLPSTYARIPRAFMVLKGEGLLLPASLAKQRKFLKRIRSVESRSFAKQQRTKRARQKT